VWAVIRAADSEQMKAIILTAWRTGLRLGEIPPLRVKEDVDVDCDEPYIIVKRNYVLGRSTRRRRASVFVRCRSIATATL